VGITVGITAGVSRLVVSTAGYHGIHMGSEDHWTEEAFRHAHGAHLGKHGRLPSGGGDHLARAGATARRRTEVGYESMAGRLFQPCGDKAMEEYRADPDEGGIARRCSGNNKRSRIGSAAAIEWRRYRFGQGEYPNTFAYPCHA